jgi:hypothetical protein
VVDGLPGRVARDRLTAVGNSLVPQVAQVWLQGIAKFYSENVKEHAPPLARASVETGGEG